MKKQPVFIALIFALFAACTSTPTERTVTGPDQALSRIFEEYYEERLKLFPLEATSQGDNRYNDQLPNDISAEYIAQLERFYRNNLDRISSINREQLSDEDKVAYDIFRRDMEVQLEGFQFRHEYIPFQQFWGMPLTIGQLGSGESNQPFKTVKDYEDWLKRISAFREWSDTAVANFRKGMAANIVLPRSLVVKMIPQMNDLVVKDPEQSLFYGPIRNLPADFSDADKARLTAAYRQAIMEELVPAYRQLGDFLQNEYLPKARSTSGIDALPQGKELYLPGKNLDHHE
jgi:uncharacterized protein (DUF885 family)